MLRRRISDRVFRVMFADESIFENATSAAIPAAA